MAVHRHVDSPTPVDRVSRTQWVSASRKRADGAHSCMGFSAHAAGVSGSAKFNQLACPAGGRTEVVPRAAKRSRASACATEGSLPLVAVVAAGCLLGGRSLH